MTEATGMSATQIKHMVERFLQWKLPENFNPDGGISFERMRNVNSKYAPPSKNEPVGTNLFDYMQAEEMVRYMLEGMPPEPPASRLAAQPGESAEPEPRWQPCLHCGQQIERGAGGMWYSIQTASTCYENRSGGGHTPAPKSQPVSPQVEGKEPATGESEELCQYAAKGIVEYMFEHFYPEVQTPNVLPDLFGKLSQISNMVTGLARKPSPAAPPESESGLAGVLLKIEKRIATLKEISADDKFPVFCKTCRDEIKGLEDAKRFIVDESRRAPSLSPELRERMATVKALAEKADGGPWTAVLQRPVTIADKDGEKSIQVHLEKEPIHGTVRRVFHDNEGRRVTQFIAETNAHSHLKWQANTQFIAAASPDFVLELIAALEGE